MSSSTFTCGFCNKLYVGSHYDCPIITTLVRDTLYTLETNPTITRDQVHRVTVKYKCDICEQTGVEICDHIQHMKPPWAASENTELTHLLRTHEEAMSQEVLRCIKEANPDPTQT